MRQRMIVFVLAVACVASASCIADESTTDMSDTGNDGETDIALYTSTAHPIVLMPGILGFEEILGTVEYFPGIVEGLTDGGADVFIVLGSQAHSSVMRGEQIIPQLEDIVAITGAPGLNLFGHSQGAIDARYIAAVRPDLVVSVTSIGGPHRGAPIADRVLDGSLTPLAAPMFGVLADFFTLMAGSTEPNDVNAAMQAMSTAGMAAFNATYPAAVPTTPCGGGAPVVDGIRYYSWAGVGSLTNPIDLLDAVWTLGSLVGQEANDGIVGQCSSHLGTVIRDDYLMNHIDETNMIFGLVSPLGPNPVTLFRNQANRLKSEGL